MGAYVIVADYNTGVVEQDYDLEEILGEDYTDNSKPITLDKLLAIMKDNHSDQYDYSEIAESVFGHNCDQELRDKILQLIALKLLYSSNTIPERGYERATNFIQEFNKDFGFTISSDSIDEIMNRDYSQDSRKVEKPVQYHCRITRFGKHKDSIELYFIFTNHWWKIICHLFHPPVFRMSLFLYL